MPAHPQPKALAKMIRRKLGKACAMAVHPRHIRRACCAIAAVATDCHISPGVGKKCQSKVSTLSPH